MKKVLVTNDDGIDAGGIRALVDALSPMADVYVVAPDKQQSAKSQSITYLRTIKPEKRDFKGAVAAYAVDGTPTDCVKWGLTMMAGEGLRPDYIFSGINLGMNTGLAAYYSGTIAAAREGALSGIRSIALSVGSHDAKEFGYILGMLPMLMEMAERVTPDTIISVNAPERPAHKMKGYKVVEAAPFGYGETYEFTEVSGGHYQMSAHPARIGDEIKYDFDAVAADYAAISPIPTSMTDQVSLYRLQNAFASDSVLTVIVDAQEEVAEELSDRGDFEANITALAHCSARMDIPMLITSHYGKGAILEDITCCTSRIETVERMQSDPWFAGDMNVYTGLIDSRKVIIAGAETHIALREAALGFIERGYEVRVVEDCCASNDPYEHRRAIRELRDAGCIITSLETEMMSEANGKEEHVRTAVERIVKELR